jgi:hypothetical protein
MKSLIRNEKDLAERILHNGFTDGFNFDEATAVAKYYRHILGYGDAKVRTNIVLFCEKYDSSFQYVPNRKTIKSLVARSNNHFYISEQVVIRKKELDEIQKLTSYRFQRILLALLVIAKLSKKTYVTTNRWSDIRQIMSRAVSTQEIRNCVMAAYKIGLIGEPKDAYHKLLFIENESEPVFILTTEKDLLGLAKNYEAYVGGSFRYCTICGKKFVRTGKKHVLCPEHTAEKEKERKRKWWNKSTRRS